MHPLAIVPIPCYECSAGYDISAIQSDIIPRRGRALLRTGFSLEIPKGFYGRLASRSGLSVRYGIEVGAGVIDSDYRGEIKVLLYNHSDENFAVNRGDRICQIILERIATDITFVEVLDETVSQTNRGDRGFGSSNHPPIYQCRCFNCLLLTFLNVRFK